MQNIEKRLYKNEITRTEKFLSFAFCFILFMPFINYYASFCLKGFGYETISVIIYPLIYIISAIAYIQLIRRTIKSLYFLMLFGLFIILTVLIFPQNIGRIFTDIFDLPYNPLYRLVFLGLPLLLIPFEINNFEYLNNKFRVFSYITLFIADFSFIYLIIISGEKFEYMTFAYYLLLPAIYCFIDSVKRKNLFLFVMSCLSLFCSAFAGSRGALVSVLMFFALYCLFFYPNGRTKAILIALLIISIIVAIRFYENIIVYLIDFTDSLNFDSRSLNNLLDETMFDSKGRDQIAEKLYGALPEKIFGYGIFGDRVIAGSYAHNVFLELWIHFGIILGTALIAVYLYITLSPLLFDKYKKNAEVFVLYFTLFSSAFIKLMFSDSYLIFPTFWAMIAFSILIIRMTKNEKHI